MKKEKQKHPLRFLWLLPGILIFDALLFSLGLCLDNAAVTQSVGAGHSFPAFTFLATVAALAVTVFILVLTVVLTVISVIRNKKRTSSR